MKIETPKGEVRPETRAERAKLYLAVFGGTVAHCFAIEAAAVFAIKLALLVMATHVGIPGLGDGA